MASHVPNSLDTNIDITGYTTEQIEEIISDTNTDIDWLKANLGRVQNNTIIYGSISNSIKNSIDNILQAEDPRKFSINEPLNATAWFKIRS